MHIDDVRRMQAEKDHLMRNEGKHPANMFQNWRSPEARAEDKARITKAEKDYAEEESARFLHGKKPSSFYAGDKSHEESKKDLESLKEIDRSYGD